MKTVVYLNHRRDVDLMRYLQRVQQMRGGVVVMRHKTLAAKLGCSESTARRAVERMVRAGHILRTYIPRERGGVLCAYRVNRHMIYRRAGLFRKARRKIEQVASTRKTHDEAILGHSPGPGGETIYKNNKKNKRRARIDHRLLNGLLLTARTAGVDDIQRGYLRAAAMRYGVEEAWRALQIAVESGYALRDVVRVTWGILKKQYPRGVMT